MTVSTPRPESRTDSPGMWQRLRRGLAKTREGMTAGLSDLFRAKRQIDAGLLEEIEARLLMADVGVDTTRVLIDALNGAVKRREVEDLEAVYASLRTHMIDALRPVEEPLFIFPGEHPPFVMLMVGVNGAGKTTTIGKLAHYYHDAGNSVLLAAGDTFRAAAIEQIQAWGKRTDTPVIAQKTGADSAAVIYDGLAAARARGIDILIADTAGRLHTKANLMEELKKIRRTLNKFDADLEVETLLVLDAGTGQNAINQALQFHETVGLTGLVLTKLDGTARGGVVFALARRLSVPIRFIGLGEQVDDLKPFEAEAFVDALLGKAP